MNWRVTRCPVVCVRVCIKMDDARSCLCTYEINPKEGQIGGDKCRIKSLKQQQQNTSTEIQRTNLRLALDKTRDIVSKITKSRKKVYVEMQVNWFI